MPVLEKEGSAVNTMKNDGSISQSSYSKTPSYLNIIDNMMYIAMQCMQTKRVSIVLQKCIKIV
jgi:hypothetical protein